MNLSRRSFLKIGGLMLGVTPFNPFPVPQDIYDYPEGELGRVAIESISIFRQPKTDAETVSYRFRDELIPIAYELTPSTGPSWNPLWYRIVGGYAHSAYVQRVKIRFNEPLVTVPEAGQLCEVTVPYTNTYRYDAYNGWQFNFRLYYQTTHWAIAVEEGPDGQPWYRLFGETQVEYFVPASHMRPILDDEIRPISPDVPWEQKIIKVSLQEQTLTAYEYDKIVLQTRISSGIPGRSAPGEISTNTPTGRFNIEMKLPTKHMGDARLTGAPEAYNLPGVPWTMFFVPDTGVAIHGAYWHNNFGVRMSHGCVNMRPDEARWLFRWCDPKFPLPIKNRQGWKAGGYGTQVIVF